MVYFPCPDFLLIPGALTETLLSGTPAKDIVKGFSRPLYTTFILSAATEASLGLGTTT